MYRYFYQIVTQFLGEGILLWVIPAALLVALLIFLSPLWLGRIEGARKKGSWGSLLVVFLADLLKLVLALGFLGLLAAFLYVQERLFSEQHGQITQRNYEAVKTKWGIPHEQYDLSVRHYVMQTEVIEKRADGGEQKQWLEEFEPPAGAEEEKLVSDEVVARLSSEETRQRPWEIVRRIRKKVRKEIAQDSIPSAEVNLVLKSNPRQLGGAVYAGYDDQWQFHYQVENKSNLKTQTVFRFPLPSRGYGLYDQLFIQMNGKDWIPKVSYQNGSLSWRMPMDPQEKVDVHLGYTSRGLEYVRYKPAEMRQHCKVAFTLEGVDPKRLNFPIGSMPPLEDVRTLQENPFTLHWNLSRAVTNLDIGVMVPTEPQPGYYISLLLRGAPLGIALMSLLMGVTRWLLQKRFQIGALGLCALAYYLTYVLIANLNDVFSFPMAFLLSTIPMTLMIVFFWVLLDKKIFPAVQTAGLFALFTIGYPLAVISDETVRGSLLYTGYSLLLVYVIMLFAFRRGREEYPQATS